MIKNSDGDTALSIAKNSFVCHEVVKILEDAHKGNRGLEMEE